MARDQVETRFETPKGWERDAFRLYVGIAALAASAALGALVTGRPVPDWVFVVVLLVLAALSPFAFRPSRGFRAASEGPVGRWLGRKEPLGAAPAKSGYSIVEPDARPAGAARVVLRVPDDIPVALLRDATGDGLRAATRALPGRGSAHAEASFEDVPGPEARVVVRIRVAGVGADPSWTAVAGEAFERAFVARLAQEGVAARAERAGRGGP